LASDTETPRKTAPAATKPGAVAKTTAQATKPEADAKTPAKAPAATKPEADAKAPARTAGRATGTRSPARTARRATGTRSPARTARRAASTAKTARRAAGKTASRATRPISEPVELKGALKQWTETARKVTEDTLEFYVKTVDQVADAEVKAAQATKLSIVATMAETNAAVSRGIAGAYVAAARDLLKA
jgi:DNA-binding protein HU-beta